MNLFEKLEERGYIKDLTHEKEIISLLNGKPMTFYFGIDPTADSLHIGHFFALTMFKWLQDYGHNGIILIGGATSRVGDPSGRSDMRNFLSLEQIERNVKEVKELVKRFVKEDTIIVNNADWFKEKNYVDFMLDIGVHFNVNTMLQADCYKNRIESGGLTFLELGYMLMQSYDFVYLRNKYNCNLQIGGSDQWANIIGGVDLSRKLDFHSGNKGSSLYGMVCPLLIKADGEKMGKTASGTLWVSRDKTTVYDFYQAWINSYDEDVERSLAFFTRLEMSYIKDLCINNIREAKTLLAFEITKLVHGEEEAIKAQKTSMDVFYGDVDSENMPSIELSKSILNKSNNGIDILVQSNIVSSKSEARRLIEQNGISINKSKVTDILFSINDLTDNYIIVQKGKKIFLKVIFK